LEDLAEKLARRSAERSLADRQAAYSDEIRKILDAAYGVIQKSESFDPRLRDVLREAGASTEAFYKHFRSKDELLLVLLDDGRRQLLGYLSHRMAKATTPAGRVRAWIEGVLAQAADQAAAARTRPFLANRDRLAERYPAEQQTSVDVLVDLLAEAIASLPGKRRANARSDAQAIYDVTFGALHRYLTSRTKPSPSEVDRLVRFSLNAVGAKA
jgi:AcrR family transcriptional regulator